MSNCDGQCSGCTTAGCDSRKEVPDFRAPANAKSKVRHVIGIISGKGGVGKSLVTSLLAAAMQRRGHRTAILDADITGPSIPHSFGVTDKAVGNNEEMLPQVTRGGTEIMSINLLLDNETDPVVWRGPVIAGMVKSFWTDVVWGEVDFMFVDMPPGTGDVALTVFQSLPLDGVIIVASPQEMVGMIVEKAVNMAGMMKIPVLALVENMSYFTCPGCGDRHELFGKSRAEELARKHAIPAVCRMPLDPAVAGLVDEGKVEQAGAEGLIGAIAMLETLK